MSYLSELAKAKEFLVKELYRRGISERYLQFGGEGPILERAPRIPTNARSEFLANRAMGDWAEGILAEAIMCAKKELKVTHYGNSQLISAGEDGFREFYISVMEEVRKYGKRPDLLVFDLNEKIPEDISDLLIEQAEALVIKAFASIEVRSSKFEARTYMRVRKEEVASGKKQARLTPSFTVKVEDLKIVYRWIERYKIPQSYCQVFFDSVYCINFLDIFRIIASAGKGITIESPAKSQEKATIMIPITFGVSIGSFTESPKFATKERVTRLGRHDAYVVPEGGALEIDSKALLSVLRP